MKKNPMQTPGACLALLVCGWCHAAALAQSPPPSPAPNQSQPAQPAPEKPSDPKQDAARQPTLDELLGLPQDKEPTSPPPQLPDQPPPDPARSELDRKLSAEEAAAEFRQAVREMGETADRIEKLRDAGLVTQRLQAEILRKLDVLIKRGQQGGASSSSSSSSASSSQRDPSQAPAQDRGQEQQSDARSEPGSAAGGGNPPFKQGTRPALDSAGVAWGALPERIRERLLQGSSDYFSALYESMTEAYYRKLAEEATEK